MTSAACAKRGILTIEPRDYNKGAAAPYLREPDMIKHVRVAAGIDDGKAPGAGNRRSIAKTRNARFIVLRTPNNAARYFGGITGSSTEALRCAPKCSVTLPPKIAGGRSVGSSCSNGPQPRIGFFMLESVVASPAYT